MKSLNRREMYQRNKEHILSNYDSPKDFIAAIDHYKEMCKDKAFGVGNDPGNFVVLEYIDDGNMFCYYTDAQNYLRNELGLDYEDPQHAWDIYRSMMRDDIRKLYKELVEKQQKKQARSKIR